jgi:ABC-2 type transport system permease protein
VTAFLAICKAMLLAFRRDKGALFFTILFPLMFLVLFGGIFQGGAGKVYVAEVGSVPVIDQLTGAEKAQFDKSVKLSSVSDVETAREKVRKGDVAAAVVQQGDQLTVYYSQADQVRAATALGVLQGVTQATAGAPKVSFAPQQVEDQSLKTIQYYTPGLLGWSLATAGTASAALTLVAWRKTQLMRRLQLAPISTATVLGARIAVSVLIGLLQMAIFVGVGSLFFGLKLSGDWWLAIPLVMAGVFAFLSLGLIVAVFARTEDAAQGIVQIIVLPMAFLSGAFFPLDGAPGWLQTVSRLMPLKYLADALRDVMVRGGGIVDILPTLGGLLLFALVLTGIASRFFRWDQADHV